MNNDIKWFLEWDESFSTGYKTVDKYHKTIVKGTKKLYELCCDTKKYIKVIPFFTEKLISIFLEHLDVEEAIFKDFDTVISFEDHIASHNKIRLELRNLNRFSFSPVIKALMINAMLIKYLIDHLEIYDKKTFEQINNTKLSQ